MGVDYITGFNTIQQTRGYKDFKCASKSHSSQSMFFFLFVFLIFIWLFIGFIDSIAEDMTGNGMRERGRDARQRAPRPELEPRATAARSKPLYMGCCSTN